MVTQLLNSETQPTRTSKEHHWQQFASRVSAALDAAPESEGAMIGLLSPAAHQLYNWIAGGSDFRQQLSLCPDTNSSESSNWSKVLYADEHTKIGLQAVYQGIPIPLHDHPGSAGIVLVLSGAVNFQYANIIGSRTSPGPIELKIARIRNRLPGQVCWFHAEDRNIHRVEAKTDRAIILVAHLRQGDGGTRHMYFPVSDYEPVEGIRFLAHRMKIQRKQSESSELN
ncbi:MAG: hypothetical protein ACWGOV_11770 [Acidiferrobacterales bacterium]